MKLSSISLVSLLLGTAAAKHYAPSKLRRVEEEYYVAVEEEEVQETNATSYTTTYYEELEEEIEEEVEEEVASYTSSFNSAFGSDDAYDLSEYFFDMSKFSLKVHSCASITGLNINDYSNSGSQSESEDGNNEWVNKTSTVVNYRLCPTDTCNSDGWSGCRNVYGNYMVSVEKYLESKMRYKEEASEQMCEKCNWCDWAYSKLGYECDVYEECQSFTCPEDGAESEEGDDDAEEEKEREEEIEYHQFAECTAVDIYVEEEADGEDYYGRRRLEEEVEDNQVYLQIYCDGGTTLKIGIYSDEDCSEFIGDQYDMAEITGLNITESDLEDELTTECVSCSEKGSKYYIPEYDGSGSGSGDTGDEEEINETCQEMYEESIKCNEYIPYNYTAYYDEVEEWEETMNNVTCAFIESVQQETEETLAASNSDSMASYIESVQQETEETDVASNSDSMSSYTEMNNNKASINGGNFYVAVAVAALVGAAIVVVKQKKTKTIKGQDLNSAFVDGGVTA